LLVVTESARIVHWLHDVARARASDVVDVSGGFGVLHRSFPYAHDHNRLIVTYPTAAESIVAAAEEVLGGAGLGHRLIAVDDVALFDRLRPDLTAAGYAVHHDLIMVHADDRPRPRSPVTIDIMDVDERARVESAGWRIERPDYCAEVVDQLGQRIRTILPVVDTEFLAVHENDGAVVARADLYLRDGIAQIENVLTAESARNRGLASALVAEAVYRAGIANAQTIFLIADASDWPRRLYGRLGFADGPLTGTFSKGNTRTLVPDSSTGSRPGRRFETHLRGRADDLN
jgi:GNAT superfamily N-acetyltransferase